MAINIQELAETYIKSSDEKHFIILYKRLKPGLLNHCRGILVDEETSEDALSNAWAKIWTKIYQYDPLRGNFSTWAYNIAKNESLAIIKARNREKIMPLIVETIKMDGSDEEKISNSGHIFDVPNWDFDNSDLCVDGLYDNVVGKFATLPEIYKEILIDREINKMKYQEIADKHGMKKRAVATRIRRARIKIREMFPSAKLNFND